MQIEVVCSLTHGSRRIPQTYLFFQVREDGLGLIQQRHTALPPKVGGDTGGVVGKQGPHFHRRAWV